MNYDIKIVGEDTDNGQIEFDRLGLLTKSTKDIATKALMLRLKGFSDITPDKHLKKALAMYLDTISGDEQEGTKLTIDCVNFAETIKGLQYELFKPKEEILQLTPMALVIQSFQTALSEDNQEADLDKPLLKSLMNFKKNFVSDNQIFYLANRGTIAEVRITKDDFQKIGQLEDSIPEPRKVIVNGQLDEMKVSKGKLGLQTEQGFVLVNDKDGSNIQDIISFMGKEITISGMAHFKPNGQLSFVEIEEFSEPGKTDKFFSKKPNAMTAKQQVLFQAKQGKGAKSFEALKALVGMWPGDETDEEFEEILKSVK